MSVLGFAYAREWPRSWRGPLDVDSGLVVPGLGAAPASSGLAVVGARSFGDRKFYGQLATSLHFAGFPVEDGKGTRFAGSNQVGDAVLLYSTVLGAVRDEVKRRAGE